MPHIDTHLFQIVTLVLLTAAVVLLAVTASSVAAVRRRLDGGAPESPAAGSRGNGFEASGIETIAPRTEAAPSDATGLFSGLSDGASVAAGDEPDEQPFERDGRWWFKRNGELLVFDEQTQEWVPAPAPSPVAVSVGGSEDSIQPLTVAPEPGGFWKCGACGAVNGSTVPSCRMCFADRA